LNLAETENLNASIAFDRQIMMDFEPLSVFELFLLASSTIHGGLPTWWPTTAIFLVLAVESTWYTSGNGDSIYFITLPIVKKAFALRLALVAATLLHELGHLVAAAATGNQPAHALFSYRNILGNIDIETWMYALFPFFPWPMAATCPHVELPARPSSRAECWVRLAAPATSIILATISTLVAFQHDSTHLAAVFAIGAWIVALGGIASDLLGAKARAGEGSIFRCGNFGMLVICAMDRCSMHSRMYHTSSQQD
jgi:hypothetical protein